VLPKGNSAGWNTEIVPANHGDLKRGDLESNSNHTMCERLESCSQCQSSWHDGTHQNPRPAGMEISRDRGCYVRSPGSGAGNWCSCASAKPNQARLGLLLTTLTRFFAGEP
jgi:hypothetical protein